MRICKKTDVEEKLFKTKTKLKKEQKINTGFLKKGASAYVTPLPLISLKLKCDVFRSDFVLNVKAA